MKKALLITLFLLLILSLLTACGGNNSGDDAPLTRPENGASDSNNSTTTPPSSTPNASVPDIDAAIGDTGKLSDYDAATRQAMIDEARKDGGDLEFKADGSVVYTDSDGSIAIQHPDGTWTYEGEDGEQGQIGGNWPDNEFTKLIPKPDFAVSIAVSDEETFSITFNDATIEQIKTYAEKVKQAGFDKEQDLTDMEAMGMVVYSYEAKNTDGYKVTVFSASGVTGLTIEKL